MTSLYTPSPVSAHTRAAADDVNAELVKIKAAFDELQAAFINMQQPANTPPVTLYTWRAYANSANGVTDFTTADPAGRQFSFIGFATNRLTATPSQNPSDYNWSMVGGSLGQFIATDTLNVAGVASSQILSDATTLALQLTAYQFDRQSLQDYVDARLYVAGVPVNTAIASEQNQRQTADTALAETIGLIGAKTSDGSAFLLDLNKAFVSPTISLGARLSSIDANAASAQAAVQNLQQALSGAGYATASDLALLGAKTLDGSAFQMNLGTVKVSPTQTMSQYINSVVASAAGSVASVQQVIDAVITPQGTAAAKAVLQLDVNGHVTGVAHTNDGTTGAVTFTVDKFNLLTPGGQAMFTADSTSVKMHNVEVDTIKAGAIITASMADNSVTKPWYVQFANWTSRNRSPISAVDKLDPDSGTLISSTLKFQIGQLTVQPNSSQSFLAANAFCASGIITWSKSGSQDVSLPANFSVDFKSDVLGTSPNIITGQSASITYTIYVTMVYTDPRGYVGDGYFGHVDLTNVGLFVMEYKK